MFWLPLTSLQERTFYGSFLFLTSTIFVTSCQFGTPSVSIENLNHSLIVHLKNLLHLHIKSLFQKM